MQPPAIERAQSKRCKGFSLGLQTGEGGNLSRPQKRSHAFSTTDMVILFWRHGRLADLLRENDLATIHVLSKRYADLDRARPFVASITITSLMGMGILPLVEMACGRQVNWVKRPIVGVAWHCDVF